MKTAEEIVEILEAYDLVGTLRGAAVLAGCDHKTVGHFVALREAAGGSAPTRGRARPLVDPYGEKIAEWVAKSGGRIRADKAHERLVAMGYRGSERTTRRAVAGAKRDWRREHGRRTRPWVPEPGLWMQWDYADGPVVAGRGTSLLCAWLAWSRYRVVVALVDRALASVVLGLDRALRCFGGAPTYALTDNERTVTVDHVCGIAVRNAQIVAASRHYGLTIATCVPADPQSKGGSVRRKWLAATPMTAVDLPALTSGDELEEPLRFLLPVEVHALADAAVEGPYHAIDRALYLTAAFTGLRQGELRGLLWQHVDFDASRVRAFENVVRGERTTPKSRRGRSGVPMARTVAHALLVVRAESSWTRPHDSVFADPMNGRPIARTSMMRRYRAALAAAGLDPGFRFHDLRHTLGTSMARAGEPVTTIQAWLGHGDLKTTQRYMHYAPAADEAERVERAFVIGDHAQATSSRVATFGP